MKRFPWLALILLIAGLGIGLAYSWFITPPSPKDADPSTLRADFKDEYRALIASAYAANGDLERARARLALLGEPNSPAALNAQAQQMLAAGKSLEDMRQVAQLAADLEQPPASTAFPTTLAFTSTPILVFSLDGTSTPAPGLTETIIPDQVIEPPATVSTPTPRPTRTSTPPPGRAFELTAQDTLCEANVQEGLLQVQVTDARRKPVPGVEIIVTWDGGEEHFFTGLKPELGNGYADFVMQAGIVYTVRVGTGGTPVTNVAPPGCTSADGAPYIGAILLSFQQP